MVGIKKTSICDALMESASHKAYTTFAQTHSFQANYWRDTRPTQIDKYKQFSQLAQWNNEGYLFNQTLKDNFAKTLKFVWIMALQDSVVWPKEGEVWGSPDPMDPLHKPILPMEQSDWYIQDLFGLKTASYDGKNYFESFDGDHLEFDIGTYDNWLHSYLLP